MRLVLDEPRYFKDSISIISELVNEARFKITPNAIELVAMDPANVAMVIFKFLSSGFMEYKVDEEFEIAINLGNLKPILKRIGANDKLKIEMDDSMVKLTISGKNTRTFNIPTLEFEGKEQRIPDLKFEANIVMSCTSFNEAIGDSEVIADSVAMLVEPNMFVLTADSTNSKAKIELSSDNDCLISSESGKAIRSKYSIDYLKKMVIGSKLADKVSISLGIDYPLKLEYLLKDRLQLVFILAPRVENS